jgi:hypothetical protein
MTATITINSDSPQAKKFLAYARTLPFADVKRERKIEPEFDVYKSLDSAFADVRLMLDGKLKKKTAKEFLEELLNEEVGKQ